MQKENLPLAFISATAPDFFIQFLEKVGYRVMYRMINSVEELPELSQVVLLMVRSNLSVDADFINQAQSLKIICRPGVGLDNLDTDYALKKGISVLNSPGANKNAVGEHTLGMLLSLLHNITEAHHQIKEGQWQREANRGEELAGKTVGIIGYGNTGSAFAEKLSGFNVKILAYDKYKRNFGNQQVFEVLEMKEVFEQVDVLSLHVPLTKATYQLVDSVFLKKFKKNIYLLNTSRGEVVDVKSLISELKRGKVKKAALDVLPNEKLSNYSPEERALLSNLLSNSVLITPHIAGWSFQSERRHFEVLIKKINQLLGF